MDMDDIIRTPPCIIILELTELDHDARKICELLSREYALPPQTALVALVSENTMGQTILEYYFADFIKFPYEIAELGFRLRRELYRCNQETAGDTINIGDLSISRSECEVKIDGQLVILTYKEYELLKYLITHSDRVCTREGLLASIWGENVISGSRTVDVHISRSGPRLAVSLVLI